MGRMNGGGGRRHGGGGFQEGQCDGKKAGKSGKGGAGKYDATTSKRAGGSDGGGRGGGRGGRGGGRGGGGFGGGRGPRTGDNAAGKADSQHAAVDLTAADAAILRAALTRVDISDGAPEPLPAPVPEPSDATSVEVDRKAKELLTKRGFKEEDAVNSLNATAAAAAEDANLGFNQRYRARAARATDWLLLRLDPAAIPKALHETQCAPAAPAAGRGGGGRGGGRGRGRGQPTHHPPPAPMPSAQLIQAHPSQDDETTNRLMNASNRAEGAAKAAHAKPVVEKESRRLSAAAEALANTQDASMKKLFTVRANLPSWPKRQDVVRAVAENQVTVISGATGSGKSTQVPRYLLDDAIARGEGGAFNCIVTQPRRISATSVAARVAQEFGEKIGEGAVGYQIRLEAKRSSATRILFVTTGVLLRRMSEDPALKGISHVVVDEVHERSLDSDFLLVLLKELLPHRPSLKVVLMSATLNASQFQRFFAPRRASGRKPALLEIPGFTHPVQEFYLEDILHVTGWSPKQTNHECLKGKPGPADAAEAAAFRELGKKGYTDAVLQTLGRIEQSTINNELIVLLLEKICIDAPPGAVLIFVSGLMEITKLHEAALNNHNIRSATKGGKLCIGLHSSLSSAEQNSVFSPAPKGARKIVIATNIAETSITIDDVVYVVDTGRVKETGFDAATRMSTLEERWVSRASANQRRGRAGRVQPGQVFRMYSRYTHDKIFAEHPEPEIRRVPLESLCLSIVHQRLPGGISGFLSKAVEAPDASSVLASVESLRRMGALDENERLTALGSHLATLPVDVRLGKLLVYASLFGCVDHALTLAAALGTKGPFVSPLDKRDEADAAKKACARGSESDHLAVVFAYEGWRRAREAGGRAAERAFIEDNFLSWRALGEIEDARRQLRSLLRSSGLLGAEGNAASNNLADPRTLPLLKAVLVAGLYPNVCRVDMPSAAPAAGGRGGGRGGRGGGRGGASAAPAEPKLVCLNATGEEENAAIHPCSVNYGRAAWSSRWLIYHQRVRTTNVFVRDATPVSPLALLLFGGQLDVRAASGTVTCDRWMTFQASPVAAAMVRETRASLDSVLAAKLSDPSASLEALGGAVVPAVLRLLASEALR